MSNIRNTETGEFGLTPADMSSWFAQQGRAASIADAGGGVVAVHRAGQMPDGLAEHVDGDGDLLDGVGHGRLLRTDRRCR